MDQLVNVLLAIDKATQYLYTLIKIQHFGSPPW